MKRISRNRKFYLIMIVEVLIVGLVSYWICRDPRELEKYEESFIKEFVHPHKDIGQPIPSAFHGKEELAFKLCRKFVRRKKRPRIVSRYLGFKKAEHKPVLVEMVKCGRGIALIQAPGHNCFHMLRKGKRNRRFDTKVFNILNKAYYITKYDDEDESANEDYAMRALSLSEEYSSSSSSSSDASYFKPPQLSRSYSAPRGYFSTSNSKPKRVETQQRGTPDHTVVKSDIQTGRGNRSHHRDDGKPSSRPYNRLAVRSPTDYSSYVERIKLPRSESMPNQRERLPKLYSRQHNSLPVEKRYTTMYTSSSRLKRAGKYLKRLFSRSRSKRNNSSSYETSNSSEMNRHKLGRSQTTRDDRVLAPQNYPQTQNRVKNRAEQSNDYSYLRKPNAERAKMSRSSSLPAGYRARDNIRQPYAATYGRSYFPVPETDRDGNRLIKQKYAPPYDRYPAPEHYFSEADAEHFMRSRASATHPSTETRPIKQEYAPPYDYSARAPQYYYSEAEAEHIRRSRASAAPAYRAPQRYVSESDGERLRRPIPIEKPNVSYNPRYDSIRNPPYAYPPGWWDPRNHSHPRDEDSRRRVPFAKSDSAARQNYQIETDHSGAQNYSTRAKTAHVTTTCSKCLSRSNKSQAPPPDYSARQNTSRSSQTRVAPIRHSESDRDQNVEKRHLPSSNRSVSRVSAHDGSIREPARVSSTCSKCSHTRMSRTSDQAIPNDHTAVPVQTRSSSARSRIDERARTADRRSSAGRKSEEFSSKPIIDVNGPRRVSVGRSRSSDEGDHAEKIHRVSKSASKVDRVSTRPTSAYQYAISKFDEQPRERAPIYSSFQESQNRSTTPKYEGRSIRDSSSRIPPDPNIVTSEQFFRRPPK